MTEYPTGDSDTDSTDKGERLVSTQCRHCGGDIDYAGTGRRPRYCSASCRTRAWAVRRAATELDREHPGPEVVREVVATERVQTVRTPGKAPTDTHGWILQLTALTRQLSGSERASFGDDHNYDQLAFRLAQALLLLDRLHPRGLNWARLPVQRGDANQRAAALEFAPTSTSTDGAAPARNSPKRKQRNRKRKR